MSPPPSTRNKLHLLEGGALDNIKLFAAIFMVIDHIHYYLLDRVGEVWMFYAGRGAFPLFCYALASAVIRSKREAPFSHVTKLLILAFSVEPISQLTRDVNCLNVIFTLAIGCAFAGIIERLKDWQIALAVFIATLSTMGPNMIEFGLLGVLLPSAMLLAIKGRRHAWPLLVFLLFTVNFSHLSKKLIEEDVRNIVIAYTIIGIFTICVFFFTLRICADSKTKSERYLPKYALHIFYPLHLILLFIIQKLVAPFS